ncbi:FAD-binding oxidoreductase [Streptomyces glomeratus]|uniref:FAD-binding oxidoreductase n=1 Tax=Streptomyces glomeratus TaxID=284452 RepID=UPI001F4529E9|nr:FAD-binding protein [Streptomyces glomeratus]MCF1512436.1 FAD-binding protein [Streptomyces glomeratus]
MSEVSRRRFLGRAAAAGGVAWAGTVVSAPDAARAAAPYGPGPEDAVTVGPSDARYQDLVLRGINKAFTGHPESIRVVTAPEQVAQVVQEAVSAGKRIAVRSGGHCFENFVDDPDVNVVIDVSRMKAVSYDPRHGAFAIESGATLGDVYTDLYLGWGVTLPAGTCPDVGIGGHLAGGGYGALAHRHGLAADHLYGVEVVVVDRSGRARTVLATRNPDDPHRDLWWGHTGGGGGNFGVVTRYLVRSPDARGDDPSTVLPRPPGKLLTCSAVWQWADLNEASFSRLVRNFMTWREQKGPTADPELNAGFTLNHAINGQIELDVGIDGTLPGAQQRIDDYLAAVSHGVGAHYATTPSSGPWLKKTLYYVYPGDYSFKNKDALLRTAWTDQQIATVHRYLTQGGAEHYGAQVFVGHYGGKVNTVAPSATAMPHRDSLFSAVFQAPWFSQDQAAAQLAWVRSLYRDVHADTGGVPVPGPAYGGCYINYPDTDIADPAWNKSGVPWHAFYYRDNYPRLQRVKAHWDPRNVFHHALSIEPGA